MAVSWNEIMIALNRKSKEWHQLKESLENALKNVPEGTIIIRQHEGKYPQYYTKEQETGQERYLNKQESDLIGKLIQKEFDRKCLSAVTKDLNALDRFLKHAGPGNISDLYESLPEVRKAWIRPAVVPDEVYARNWQKEMEEKKERNLSVYPINGEIVTEKGERVRSKSEKIIADKLGKEGIPYVYEAPLYLDGAGIVYPDFTILDLAGRQTVYFEHFGMMDDSEYCQKALNKIQIYAANGYWFGGGLLYTFETSEMPLHTVFLDRLVDRYLGAQM